MTTTTAQRCDYCGTTADQLDWWLPERYRADRFRPGSFSADELIGTCSRCSDTYSMSHDPDEPRKKPRRPWFEAYLK